MVVERQKKVGWRVTVDGRKRREKVTDDLEFCF